MPIFIDLATLVLTKNIVEKHYKGGVEQFKIDFNFDKVVTFEEDNELLSLSNMNFGDIPVQEILDGGVPKEQFNEKNMDRETVYCSKYGGAISNPSCFEFNDVFIWHKSCSAKSIAKAKYIGESPLDEIFEMLDEGLEPFNTFA